YRLGLCHEVVGHAEQAITSYREAIGASSSPPLTFACHLGMARCLLRQDHPAEARQLLSPFLLDEARQEAAPDVFVTDAYYLVALSLAHRSASRSAPDDPISYASLPLETPMHLDDLAVETPGSAAVTAP